MFVLWSFSNIMEAKICTNQRVLHKYRQIGFVSNMFIFNIISSAVPIIGSETLLGNFVALSIGGFNAALSAAY